MKRYCEECRFWKSFGYHYYECTNDESDKSGVTTFNSLLLESREPAQTSPKGIGKEQ